MFSGRKQVGTLIVDNHSPFTPNILDCMKVLGENYLCRKFSDAISYQDLHFTRVILSGRRKNSKDINVINSRIIKYCLMTNRPILGICYGAEIMALTLGGSLARLNNPLQNTVNVTVLQPNPLVSSKTCLKVYESHKYCVAQLPSDFKCLASSSFCKYEIFSHKQKMLFGTQFHPERSGQDGLMLLSNFLKLQ
jgi:GMP synthase (glutamine-hydrolysing)